MTEMNKAEFLDAIFEMGIALDSYDDKDDVWIGRVYDDSGFSIGKIVIELIGAASVETAPQYLQNLSQKVEVIRAEARDLSAG